MREGGIPVTNDSDVYEVKYADTGERLTIGKASNLRMRVKRGLVKSRVPVSTGIRIREVEDTALPVVRWATTVRSSCAEEELHRLHRDQTGGLPKYSLCT